MSQLTYKHPRAVRWLHWLNVPLLGLMLWSGLLIYRANDVYRIGWGDVTLVHFFPREVYDLLRLNGRLAEGMAIHFFVMWLFALNGLLYVLYTLFSGQWRFLLPDRRSFRDAWQVFVNDLGLSRARPPQGKFNGAQRIAYTLVILMAAGSLTTGLAIDQPVQFAWLTALLGGYEWARWEHFWLAAGFVLFIFIHVVQVIRAGWNNCRSMITGYEVVSSGEAAHGGKQEPAGTRVG